MASTLPKLKQGDLIQIWQRDAGKVLPDQTWVDVEEIDFDETDNDLGGPQTTGYFLKKTDNAIYVCQTYCKGCCIGPFAIPLGCIQVLEKK